MRATDDGVPELVDRCFLVGMAGTSPDADFSDWVASGLGGVILFAGNIVDRSRVSQLCATLRATGSELLVAVDEEGGDITRLHARDGSPTPGNLALGAVDDPELTRDIAHGIGTDLRAANINLNLAPTVDVNTNPNNPVIGTRSFGADPELVARHTVAYIRGLHDAGIAACAKHFPGHGDTDLDSHHALPVISGDLEPHLVPFKAAIDAGVDAILTAHIVYPGLDEQPATLSPRVLTGLLRDELGFAGAIITDSLSMAAIAERVGLAEGAVLALSAGADLLCMNSSPGQQRQVRDSVVEAVRAGRIPMARIREAAARVRRLAAPRSAGTEQPRHRWDAATARGALYLDAPLPLPDAPYVIELAQPRLGIEPSAASLLEILRTRAPGTDGIGYRDAAAGVDPKAAIAAAGGRPLVLVVKDAHRNPDQRAVLSAIRAERPDALVVGTGTTADAQLAPGHYVGTRGAATGNLRTAAEVLAAGPKRPE